MQHNGRFGGILTAHVRDYHIGKSVESDQLVVAKGTNLRKTFVCMKQVFIANVQFSITSDEGIAP